MGGECGIRMYAEPNTDGPTNHLYPKSLSDRDRYLMHLDSLGMRVRMKRLVQMLRPEAFNIPTSRSKLMGRDAVL